MARSPFRRDLVLSHLELVERLADRYHPRWKSHIERDDLVSAGRLGLLRAADDYDPGRGVRFSTYAYRRIFGAMVDELRAADPVSRSQRQRGNSAQVRPASAVPLADAEESDLFACLPDPGSASVDAEAAVEDSVRQILRRLAPRQRLLVRLYLLESWTFRACGRLLGRSESWASTQYAAALETLSRETPGK